MHATVRDENAPFHAHAPLPCTKASTHSNFGNRYGVRAQAQKGATLGISRIGSGGAVVAMVAKRRGGGHSSA